MKKNLLFFLASFLLTFLSSNVVYSSNEPYRNIKSGNWNSASTWQIFISGTGWVPAASAPDASSGPITIGFNDTVTINTNIDVDELLVTTGGYVFINILSSLTIVDGPGNDLTMHSGSIIYGPGKLYTSGYDVILYTYTANAAYDDSRIFTSVEVMAGKTTLPYVSGLQTVIYGELKVNSGTELSVGTLFCFNNVINDGIISKVITGSLFIRKASSLINNGSISITNLDIDDSTNLSISGFGNYNVSNFIIGNNNSVVINLLNDLNLNVSSLFNFYKGIIYLNNYSLTLSGYIHFNTNFTIIGPGIIKTQGFTNINLGAGLHPFFDVPLRVEKGITSLSSNLNFSETITIDSGAKINCGNSIAYNDIINNGTIVGNFQLYGSNFINNGSISGASTGGNFYFENGNHTLSGTGSIKKAIFNLGSNSTMLSNHNIGEININSGAAFDISNYKLSLSANVPIVNNGTFITTNSTIEYNGTSSQSLSTTNVSYRNLRINNPAGVTLGSALTLNDTLSIVNGDFNIAGTILTLSPTAYLIETPGNTVTGFNGYIQTTQTINTPLSINVAGMGAILTSASNFGSTIIKRGNNVQINLNGTTSILRYFDITPTNNTGLNATLTFKYDDSELNSRPEGSLQLFRSTNSGSTWTFRGGTINTTTNEITLSGIDAFSRWSAGSGYLTSSIKVIPQGLYNSSSNRMNRKDTVRAYLRNVSSPFAIVDSAKSIIDSVTFNCSFIFTNAPTGIYYVQTKHRNSLETWSKSGGEAYNLGSTFSYDFTTASSQAFGNNMMQADASPVKYAIYTGDVNQDGAIDLTDVIQTYNDANNFITGYVVTDLNRDNITDLTDVLMAYNNSVNFVGVVRP